MDTRPLVLVITRPLVLVFVICPCCTAGGELSSTADALEGLVFEDGGSVPCWVAAVGGCACGTATGVAAGEGEGDVVARGGDTCTTAPTVGAATPAAGNEVGGAP